MPVIAPGQTVGVDLPVDGSVVGPASVAQKLEETNLLLRAMVLLLCNMNDIDPTAILSLATSLTNVASNSDGSVLGLLA